MLSEGCQWVTWNAHGLQRPSCPVSDPRVYVHCPSCRPLTSPPIPDDFFPAQEAFCFWKLPLLKGCAHSPPDTQLYGTFTTEISEPPGTVGTEGSHYENLVPLCLECQESISRVLRVHDILMGLFWQSFWCINFEAATTKRLFWLGILMRPLGEASSL